MLNFKSSLGPTWLVRIRWVAAITQLVTFLLIKIFLLKNLPNIYFYCAFTLLFISNSLLNTNKGSSWLNKKNNQGVILIFDIITLTALLYFYGGYSNPFSMLYLIQVMLAALLLGGYWTWLISTLSSLCYSLLFFYYIEIPALAHQHHQMHSHSNSGGGFNLHLQGMLFAFILISFIISAFMQKMREEINKRELELLSRKSNEGKLAAVATLSASIAHELSSPLGTIALISEELSKELPKFADNEELTQDINLLKTEVERCTFAVERLRQNTDGLSGEYSEEFSIPELIKDILNSYSKEQRIRISFEETVENRNVKLPREGLRHSIVALIKNSLEASQKNTPVDVSFEPSKETIKIKIQDSGCGMTKEQILKVGEPFFTTKDSLRGMGLGLFISKLFTERLGGEFTIESTLEKGTLVTIILPRFIEGSF